MTDKFTKIIIVHSKFFQNKTIIIIIKFYYLKFIALT